MENEPKPNSAPDAGVVSNGIKSWDEDVDSIPRLQIIDENQNFTYVHYWCLHDAHSPTNCLDNTAKTCQATWKNGRFPMQDSSTTL